MLLKNRETKQIVSYPKEIEANRVFSPIIEELKNGDFSITKKGRRNELMELLKVAPHFVPIDFTNLIMKQLIERKGKSFPIELVGYTVQCLGHYVLKQNNRDCNIQIKENLGCLGCSGDEGIAINDSTIQNLRYGSGQAITVLFHEINHRLQNEFKERKRLQYCSYEFQQDEILLDYSQDYYDQNYDHIYAEIDSNLKSQFLFYRYLKEISPETAKKLKREIYWECKKEVKNKTQKRKYKYVSLTREELVDTLISQQPNLLKEYPIFQLFYKADGSKIPLAQILLDYKDAHDKKYELECLHSPLELKENNDYEELVAKVSFYKQVLRYRTGSYENTKKDYLSITSNFSFLESCANDPWLEEERKKLLERYEKKYIYLALLRERRNFLEQSEIVGEVLQKIEQIQITPPRLNILKRTLASIQYLKDSIIKEHLVAQYYDNHFDKPAMENYRK